MNQQAVIEAVQVFSLTPDDALILKLPQRATEVDKAEAQKIAKELANIWDTEVIILPADWEIAVAENVKTLSTSNGSR